MRRSPCRPIIGADRVDARPLSAVSELPSSSGHGSRAVSQADFPPGYKWRHSEGAAERAGKERRGRPGITSRATKRPRKRQAVRERTPWLADAIADDRGRILPILANV